MPQMGESGGEVVGAAGELIAAMLQTIALYSQDDVINNFEPVLGSLGAIAYIVAVLGALWSVVLFGNYKKALYLALGPTLFWWMLTARTPATHIDICMANVCDAQSQDQIHSFLKVFTSLDPDVEPTPQVSWFFARWDSVVSNVVQSVSTVLLDAENKEHLLVAAQERSLPTMLVARIVDKPFAETLSAAYVGECARPLTINQELGRLRADRDSKQDAITRLEDDGDAAQATKTGLQQELQLINGRIADLEAELQSAQAGFGTKTIPYPEDLRRFAGGLVPPFTWTAPENELKVSCQEIHRIVERATKNETDKYLELTPEQQNDPEIPWDKVRDNLIKALGGDPSTAQGVQDAKDRLAALILKNSLGSQTHSAMTAQLSSHSPWEQDNFTITFSNLAGHNARGHRMTLLHFAGSIPYVQGLLLYLLTILFPFFTIFLIMPGRYSAFFVWMTLWAWVKSWDIGFAFVDFVRDLLFQYINPLTQTAENQNFDWNDPSSVYALVNTHDPLASMNTYYVVIGILTLAVPAFTAHVCLGATTLFDAFKGTMGQTSKDFGRRTAQRSRNFEWSEVNNERERYVTQAGLDAVKAAGYSEDDLKTDNSNARNAHAIKQAAEYKARFSKDVQKMQQLQAGLSGRKMTYSNNAAMGDINAAVNEVNTKHLGRGAAGDNNSWFGSSKANSSKGDANWVQPGSRLPSGHDNDGE